MKNFIRILFLSALVSLILASKIYATISGSLDSSGYRFMADDVYNVHTCSEVQSAGLCIYGSDDVASSILSRYSDVIVLKDTHSKQCKLIYIAEDRVRLLSDIIAEFNKRKIPTISFIPGFTDIEN